VAKPAPAARPRPLLLAAACCTLSLCACAPHAQKALAVAAQPGKLSVPQTQVTLPPAQPVNPAALPQDTEAAQAPPPAAVETPQPVPSPALPPARPRAAPSRPAASPAAQTQPQPQAQTPPVVEAPAERPAIQAVVPAAEIKKLKDSADARKRDVRAILARMNSRRLSAADQDLVKRIEFFLSQSDDAEKRGDMSQADAFAQRAQDLAKGWQSAH